MQRCSTDEEEQLQQNQSINTAEAATLTAFICRQTSLLSSVKTISWLNWCSLISRLTHHLIVQIVIVLLKSQGTEQRNVIRDELEIRKRGGKYF